MYLVFINFIAANVQFIILKLYAITRIASVNFFFFFFAFNSVFNMALIHQ